MLLQDYGNWGLNNQGPSVTNIFEVNVFFLIRWVNIDFNLWENQCHTFSSESHRESLSGEEDNWPRVTIWLHGPVVPGAAEEREWRLPQGPCPSLWSHSEHSEEWGCSSSRPQSTATQWHGSHDRCQIMHHPFDWRLSPRGFSQANYGEIWDIMDTRQKWLFRNGLVACVCLSNNSAMCSDFWSQLFVQTEIKMILWLLKRQFDDYLTVFKGKAKDQIAKCTKQIQFCKNSILAFPLVIFDYLIFHMAVTKKRCLFTT